MNVATTLIEAYVDMAHHHDTCVDTSQVEATRYIQIAPQANCWSNMPSQMETSCVDPRLRKSAHLILFCRFQCSDNAELCKTIIMGANRLELKNGFEMHLIYHHHHDISERTAENGKRVCDCPWVKTDGNVCGESLELHSEARPCNALVQHISKWIDDLTLYSCSCRGGGTGCNGSDLASHGYATDKRHYHELPRTPDHRIGCYEKRRQAASQI